MSSGAVLGFGEALVAASLSGPSALSGDSCPWPPAPRLRRGQVRAGNLATLDV